MSYLARKAIARVVLFSSLPGETLDELVQMGTTHTTPPGQRVVAQGARDAGLQVVLDGTADVTVNGVSRKSLAAGDYFGEISMIDGQPRSATIVSGPDGLTTFMLSTLAFAPMIERPDVSRTLLNALCARIRNLESSEAD